MAVGDSDAAYNLGVLYETGVVHLNQRILSADMFMALKYFLIASKSNHTPSDLRLGTIYLVSEEYQDYPKALSYLTRAANNDDADAMNLLGQMKELGIGNDESSIPDYISARFWYKKAYHKGHLGAMFNLGNLYECGVGGVEKDFERALKFYSKAATQGHQDSIDRLIDLREMEDDE